jgi:hypothetical protein
MVFLNDSTLFMWPINKTPLYIDLIKVSTTVIILYKDLINKKIDLKNISLNMLL